MAVPACDFAFALTFDTTTDVSVLATDGHLLTSFSPSPDGPSFVGAYFAFTPASTGYSADALAQAEPCGPRSQP